MKILDTKTDSTISFECDLISTVANFGSISPSELLVQMAEDWKFKFEDGENLIENLISDSCLRIDYGRLSVVPAEESLITENPNPDSELWGAR